MSDTDSYYNTHKHTETCRDKLRNPHGTYGAAYSAWISGLTDGSGARTIRRYFILITELQTAQPRIQTTTIGNQLVVRALFSHGAIVEYKDCITSPYG